MNKILVGRAKYFFGAYFKHSKYLNKNRQNIKLNINPFCKSFITLSLSKAQRNKETTLIISQSCKKTEIVHYNSNGNNQVGYIICSNKWNKHEFQMLIKKIKPLKNYAIIATLIFIMSIRQAFSLIMSHILHGLNC